MDDILSYLELSSLSFPELCLRVAIAMLFGLVLGWDRDTKNKPIDFRAYIIVAVTTCVIAIMGDELYLSLSLDEGVSAPLDFAKIIAGAMTGIGFLGAGAIIHKQGNEVVGTATGASIWAAGGMGLAIGYGLYGLALVAFLAIAFTLIGGGFCMSAIQGNKDSEQSNENKK